MGVKAMRHAKKCALYALPLRSYSEDININVSAYIFDGGEDNGAARENRICAQKA